jgi:hypothetical protein
MFEEDQGGVGHCARLPARTPFDNGPPSAG